MPFLTPTSNLRILEKFSIFIVTPLLTFFQPRLTNKAVRFTHEAVGAPTRQWGKHYIARLELALPIKS